MCIYSITYLFRELGTAIKSSLLKEKKDKIILTQIIKVYYCEGIPSRRRLLAGIDFLHFQKTDIMAM